MLKHKLKYKTSLPIQLLITVIICILIGKDMSYESKSFFYAISLTLKDTLIFFLPIIIFSYIAHCIISINNFKVSIVMIGLLMINLSFSNFLASFVAYSVGLYTHQNMQLFNNIHIITHNDLNPAWVMYFNNFIPNEISFLLGLIIGIILTFKKTLILFNIINKMKSFSDYFLNNIFIPLVPLFSFGFLIKIYEDNTVVNLFNLYGKLFLIIIGTLFVYLVLFYGAANNFNLLNWQKSIGRMFTPILVSFTSMSSIATMPFTINATEKNTDNSPLVKTTIPATVNTHLIGDSIAIPIMAIAIHVSFFGYIPDLATFLKFSIYFMFIKFAVAAVPAGGIIISMPVLAQYLSFSVEMLAMITAIYIIMDPIITMANVLGNGAFSTIFIQKFKKLLMSYEDEE